MKRYILFPGRVRSRTDGDIHFVGAVKLARLYGVPLDKCLVVRGDNYRYYKKLPGDICLFPRSDGNYKLPEVNDE